MCFLKHPKHPALKTATKDIKCYKVLVKRNSKVYSPYKGMEYVFDRTHIRRKNQLGISFFTKTDMTNFIRINEGLHSYSAKKKAKSISDPKYNWLIYESIIPKGSLYWYNPYRKEYVSNKLIVTQTQVPQTYLM